MNTWCNIDDLNQHIKKKLNSDELNQIINCDYYLNENENNNNNNASNNNFFRPRNSNSSSNNSNYSNNLFINNNSRPVSSTIYEKILQLNITETDLNEVELALEKLDTFLNSFRLQLLDSLKPSGVSDLEKHTPVYTRFQLNMDKFKFELSYLRSYTPLNTQHHHHHQQQQRRNSPSQFSNNQDEKENRFHIDLNSNSSQVNYKSTSTHRSSSKSDYPDMLTNIHLDFQVNYKL